MPIQTDVTTVLAHADRSHSETCTPPPPSPPEILHSVGPALWYTAPQGQRTHSLVLGPLGNGCADGTRASGAPTCVGALRSRPGQQGRAQGGQPRGSELARSGSGRCGRRRKRKERKGEGAGGRRRGRREVQRLSQALQAGRESARSRWVCAPWSRGPLHHPARPPLMVPHPQLPGAAEP